MLLLALTPFGWAFLLAILLSLFLTRGVVRRMWPTEPAGCFSYGFLGLIITMLMIAVLTTSLSISESIYGYITKPKYEATIVSYTSSWQESSTRDSDGRSRTTRTLMHTPTVQFISEDGQTVKLETNVASGGRPVIGDHLTVVYAPGDMVAPQISPASIGLLFGATLMLFIMSMLLFAAIQYARGADMAGIKSFSVGFVLRFLIPFGMLFLLSGMGYALWQYFAGKKDMPLWAAIICGFFSFVLLLTIPTFLRMAFGRTRSVRIR